MVENDRIYWKKLLPLDTQVRNNSPKEHISWSQSAESLLQKKSPDPNDAPGKESSYVFSQLQRLDYRQNLEIGQKISQLRTDIENYAKFNHISLNSLSDAETPLPLRHLILSFHEQVNLLVAGNLGLVPAFTTRHRYLPVQDYEDVLSAGISGLISAATRYEPYKTEPQKKPVPQSFSAYARFHIHSYVSRELHTIYGNGSMRAGELNYLHLKQSPDAQPGSEASHLMDKARKMTNALLFSDIIFPESHDDCEKSGQIPELTVEEYVEEYVADNTSSSVEELVEESSDAAQIKSGIHQAAKELSPIQQKVLELRVFQNKTQKEVANEIGVTSQRISQIEILISKRFERSKILRNLRKTLEG